MNKIQQKKLDMGLALKQFFINYPPFPVMPIAFLAAINQLTSIIVIIQTIARAQGQVISGITANKKTQKMNLASFTAILASIIYTWASEPLNESVRKKATYSLSDLERLTDNPLVTVATNMIALAQPHIDELINFGDIQMAINDLTAAIDLFCDVQGLPREAIIERTNSGDGLEVYFKQMDVLIKEKFDKMMFPIKVKSPTAYAKYAASKSVIGSGTTVTQLKGKVIAAGYTKGLKNVLVTLAGSAEQLTTSTAGIFSFKGLSNGVYSITLTATGYQDLTINNIDVKQGKLNTQKITMEKTIETLKD